MLLKTRIVLAVFAIVVVVLATYLIWNYMNYLEYLKEIVHETNRWAVIEDSHGQHIAVEPTNDEVWNQLVGLYNNKTEKWIGGIVEKFNNKWGFRFKPENVTIADVTAEGLQTWIQDISENLDYWLGLGWAYVHAEVTEIHE